MAAAKFLDVFEEETNKKKENAVTLTITWAIILKHLFSSYLVNIRLGDYSTIYTEPSANNNIVIINNSDT